MAAGLAIPAVLDGAAMVGSWFGTSAATVAGVAGAAGTVGATALAAQAFKPKMPNMPPSPFMPQATVDQDTQAAEEAARRRQGSSQGIDSTVGAGQGGMLNPSTMGQKQLLGA